MSNVTDVRIKCGKCKGYHASVEDIKICCGLIQPVVQPPQSGAVAQSGLPVQQVNYLVSQGYGFATDKQLAFVNDLGGDLKKAWGLSWRGCSRYIDELKQNKKRSTVVTTAPNRQTSKIPQALLEQLRDGYFAARLDSTRPYTFLRVSRPTTGQYKGALKVQTVHGSAMGHSLKIALVIYNFGTPNQKFFWKNMSIEDDLMLVCVDLRGTAREYAEKMGECCCCGASLTDDRSRWYGIGPECEKKWPEIIEEVNDTKGYYKPGSGN